MRQFSLPLAFLLSALALGCGDDDSSADAATDSGSGCPESCDDGLFCNGEERCEAGECVVGEPPCAGACDEEIDRCEGCADVDGDGHEDAACGGDDCDDEDADRFPGNDELCDDIDQDCDPSTIGDTDLDGDGEIDAMCCNGELCGTDCDDTRSAVFEGASEVCNRIDDDCDGVLDEGALMTFYRDMDDDGFGTDDPAMTMEGCEAPPGFSFRGGDCDDALPERNPGNPERCVEYMGASIDENCSLTDGPNGDGIDEGCECTAGEEAPCVGEAALGVCAMGTRLCTARGTFSDCSILPGEEDCNTTEDDDCDGFVDDVFDSTTRIVRPSRLMLCDAQTDSTRAASCDFNTSSLELLEEGAATGAAWITDSFEVGYGPVSFAPTWTIDEGSETRLLLGWSAFLVESIADRDFNPLGTDLSFLPKGTIGFAAERAIQGDDDSVRIHRFTGSSLADTLLVRCVLRDVEPSGGFGLRFVPRNESMRRNARVEVVDSARSIDEPLCAVDLEDFDDWGVGTELIAGVSAKNRNRSRSAFLRASILSERSGPNRYAVCE